MGTYLKLPIFGVEWNVYLVETKADGLSAIERGEIAVKFSLLCKLKSNDAKEIAARFRESSTLLVLELSANDIGSRGAKSIANALKENRTLKVLSLEDRSIGPKGAKSIADALKVNKTLQALNLCDNYMGPEGSKSIADALKTNRTLQSLNLQSNKISDKGAKSIADALKLNNTLQTLEIGANPVGPEGAKSIADALKVNNTLQTLELGGSSIGDEGAKSIADALKVNKDIQTLDLFNNSIGRKGFKSIADALMVNKSLQTLCLRCNEICDEGAKSIADALKVNNTLQTLVLSGTVFSRANRIGDEGAKSIADALKVNKTLQTLTLGSNEIGPEGAKSIADALKVNKTLQELSLFMNHIGLEGSVSLAACASFQVDGVDYSDARVKAAEAYGKQARTLGLFPQTVPKEILNRDSRSKAKYTSTYLQGLLYSSDSVHQLKVLLVGPQQVGKTSLRRALKIKGKRANPTKCDDADRATISMDVDKIFFEPCRIFTSFPQKSNKTVGEISLWEFGSQEEFYLTHPFFLSNRSLVMVVVDLEAYVDTEESFEDVAGKWLQPLQMQIFRPKVVIVGTKCDTQTQDQIDRKLLSLVKRVDCFGLKVKASIAAAHKPMLFGEQEIERLDVFEGFSFTEQRSFAVSGVDMNSGDGVEILYEFLQDLASNPDKGLALCVPNAFEDLRSMIKEKLQTEGAFIQDVAVLQQEAGLEGNDEMFRLALGLMHDLGIVLWFEKNDQLCDFVFSDPSWVVDIVRQVFRHDIFVRREGSNSKGVLYDLKPPLILCELLEKKCILDAELLRQFPLWETFDDKLFGCCLLLLQQLELMFKLVPREQDVERREQFMVPLFLHPGFVGEKARTWRVSKRFSLTKNLRQSFGRLQNSLTASSWIESTQQVDYVAFLPHGLLFWLIARTHRIAEFTKISADSADAIYSHVSGHVVHIKMKLRENMNGSGVLMVSCRCDAPDLELVRVFERTKDLISNEIDRLMEEPFRFVPYISKWTINHSKSEILGGQLPKTVRRSMKGSLLVSKGALENFHFRKKEGVVRSMLKFEDPYTVKELFIEATEHQLEMADQKTDYLSIVGKDIRGKLKNIFQLNWSTLIDGDPLKADLRRFDGRFEGKEWGLSRDDAKEYLLLVRRLVTRVRTRFDCFMAHSWGEGDSNHEEVKKLADYLGKRGLSCWVEDQRDVEFIRPSMLQGIQESHVFVACITDDYLEDVKMGEMTNCGIEFNSAGNRSRDDMVPYLMDEDLSEEALLPVLPRFGGKKYFTQKGDLFDNILQQLFPYDEAEHRESLISMYPSLREQEAD